MTTPGELTVSQALTQDGPFLLTRAVARGDQRRGKNATRRLDVVNLGSDWGYVDRVTVEWSGDRQARRLVFPTGHRLAPGDVWTVIDHTTPDEWGNAAHRTFQGEFGDMDVVHQVTVHVVAPTGFRALTVRVAFGFAVSPQGYGFYLPDAPPLEG